MTHSHVVDGNLRECFRALAAKRIGAHQRDSQGVELISLGVRFQMFNAAFLSDMAAGESDLERKLLSADVEFRVRGVKWSFWLSDAYLPGGFIRRAPRVLARHELSPVTEMPGMIIDRLPPAAPNLPVCEARQVESAAELTHFDEIGAACFRVPLHWFSEVFDSATPERAPFRAWVGYRDGAAICTAATVVSEGAIGLYNVATLPEFRSRGYAEALMRRAIDAEISRHGERPIVLQSTAAGLGLYNRLGFQDVTRFRVFVSN